MRVQFFGLVEFLFQTLAILEQLPGRFAVFPSNLTVMHMPSNSMSLTYDAAVMRRDDV